MERLSNLKTCLHVLVFIVCMFWLALSVRTFHKTLFVCVCCCFLFAVQHFACLFFAWVQYYEENAALLYKITPLNTTIVVLDAILLFRLFVVFFLF